MRCSIRVSLAVLMCMAFSIAARGADDKKKSAEPPKERLVPLGNLQAQVTPGSNYDGGKALKLRVHGKVPEIKWEGSQNYRPGQRPGGFKVTAKDEHVDIDVTLADDVKVRRAHLLRDDKGTPILDSLKKDPKDPDRNLPGVKASEKDIKAGQWVIVSRAATREKEPQVFVTLVIIISEAPRPK